MVRRVPSRILQSWAEPTCYLGFPLPQQTEFSPVSTIFIIVGGHHVPIQHN